MISIVLLGCGLTAWGGERGYDQNDTLKTHELDKYVMKENEAWKDLIEQVVRDVVG
ncbi:MAG: hypothetical protein J6Q37_05905 [Bacteroidales bacterium]|nr:hypothetical protein [Bacteroidales bacterium]